MKKRCDQIINCPDQSDEEECSLLQLKKGYNKKVPPFDVDEQSNVIPVTVNISTTLMNVLKISEVDHIIELKFAISLQWHENRAKYQNLKENEALNMLSDNELAAIWIPYIIFRNTDNDEAVRIGNIETSASVTREGTFQRSPPEVADEIEVFEGKENRITMNQTHSKEFHCTYLLHFFPFDTQVMLMVIEKRYDKLV